MLQYRVIWAIFALTLITAIGLTFYFVGNDRVGGWAAVLTLVVLWWIIFRAFRLR